MFNDHSNKELEDEIKNEMWALISADAIKQSGYGYDNRQDAIQAAIANGTSDQFRQQAIQDLAKDDPRFAQLLQESTNQSSNANNGTGNADDSNMVAGTQNTINTSSDPQQSIFRMGRGRRGKKNRSPEKESEIAERNAAQRRQEQELQMARERHQPKRKSQQELAFEAFEASQRQTFVNLATAELKDEIHDPTMENDATALMQLAQINGVFNKLMQQMDDVQNTFEVDIHEENVNQQRANELAEFRRQAFSQNAEDLEKIDQARKRRDDELAARQSAGVAQGYDFGDNINNNNLSTTSNIMDHDNTLSQEKTEEDLANHDRQQNSRGQQAALQDYGQIDEANARPLRITVTDVDRQSSHPPSSQVNVIPQEDNPNLEPPASDYLDWHSPILRTFPQRIAFKKAQVDKDHGMYLTRSGDDALARSRASYGKNRSRLNAFFGGDKAMNKYALSGIPLLAGLTGVTALLQPLQDGLVESAGGLMSIPGDTVNTGYGLGLGLYPLLSIHPKIANLTKATLDEGSFADIPEAPELPDIMPNPSILEDEAVMKRVNKRLKSYSIPNTQPGWSDVMLDDLKGRHNVADRMIVTVAPNVAIQATLSGMGLVPGSPPNLAAQMALGYGAQRIGAVGARKIIGSRVLADNLSAQNYIANQQREYLEKSPLNSEYDRSTTYNTLYTSVINALFTTGAFMLGGVGPALVGEASDIAVKASFGAVASALDFAGTAVQLVGLGSYDAGLRDAALYEAQQNSMRRTLEDMNKRVLKKLRDEPQNKNLLRGHEHTFAVSTQSANLAYRTAYEEAWRDELKGRHWNTSIQSLGTGVEQEISGKYNLFKRNRNEVDPTKILTVEHDKANKFLDENSKNIPEDDEEGKALSESIKLYKEEQKKRSGSVTSLRDWEQSQVLAMLLQNQMAKSSKKTDKEVDNKDVAGWLGTKRHKTLLEYRSNVDRGIRGLLENDASRVLYERSIAFEVPLARIETKIANRERLIAGLKLDAAIKHIKSREKDLSQGEMNRQLQQAMPNFQHNVNVKDVKWMANLSTEEMDTCYKHLGTLYSDALSKGGFQQKLRDHTNGAVGAALFPERHSWNFGKRVRDSKTRAITDHGDSVRHHEKKLKKLQTRLERSKAYYESIKRVDMFEGLYRMGEFQNNPSDGSNLTAKQRRRRERVLFALMFDEKGDKAEQREILLKTSGMLQSTDINAEYNDKWHPTRENDWTDNAPRDVQQARYDALLGRLSWVDDIKSTDPVKIRKEVSKRMTAFNQTRKEFGNTLKAVGALSKNNDIKDFVLGKDFVLSRLSTRDKNLKQRLLVPQDIQKADHYLNEVKGDQAEASRQPFEGSNELRPDWYANLTMSEAKELLVVNALGVAAENPDPAKWKAYRKIDDFNKVKLEDLAKNGLPSLDEDANQQFKNKLAKTMRNNTRETNAIVEASLRMEKSGSSWQWNTDQCIQERLRQADKNHLQILTKQYYPAKNAALHKFAHHEDVFPADRNQLNAVNLQVPPPQQDLLAVSDDQDVSNDANTINVRASQNSVPDAGSRLRQSGLQHKTLPLDRHGRGHKRRSKRRKNQEAVDTVNVNSIEELQDDANTVNVNAPASQNIAQHTDHKKHRHSKSRKHRHSKSGKHRHSKSGKSRHSKSDRHEPEIQNNVNPSISQLHKYEHVDSSQPKPMPLSLELDTDIEPMPLSLELSDEEIVPASHELYGMLNRPKPSQMMNYDGDVYNQSKQYMRQQGPSNDNREHQKEKKNRVNRKKRSYNSDIQPDDHERRQDFVD